MDKLKSYLPSKKFLTILMFLIVIVVLFFAIKQTISYFKNKNSKEPALEVIQVSSLTQKDSNDNGIADWEEYLWGLNPAKNGPENKEFILSKKKALGEKGLLSGNDESNLTQNEVLSRQFFATIVSLIETDQVDEASLQSVAEAVGQNISETPMEDIYDKSMLTIRDNTEAEKSAYHSKLSALMTKYQDSDIGSELILISQGLASNDIQALYAVRSISASYRAFASDLMTIPVPYSLSDLHIKIANNYEKVADSIDGLTQVLSDPIVGMNSIISYKKYSDLLNSDLEELYNALQ